jgi:spermidine/putrescine transport system permease protein
MVSRAVSIVFVLAIYTFVYLPIGLVVLTAFNQATITTLPIQGYSLKWFAALFTNLRTLDALWTSVFLGALAAVAATMLGLFAALAVMRHHFPGRRAFLALMALPARGFDAVRLDGGWLEWLGEGRPSVAPGS